MVTAIRKGFTLVELLIVITILVILGIFVILLINPAEILAKSRDSQRISDLATMKGAMQLFLTDPGVNLTTLMTTECLLSADTPPIPESEDAKRIKINVSLKEQPDTNGTPMTNKYSGSFGDANDSNRKKNDGNGWVPVNLTQVQSGAPLEMYPSDPSADLSAADANPNTDILDGFYYRFGCWSNGGKFEYEFDAGLESSAYGPLASGGGKGGSDGGNANGATKATSRYEVGNNLTILPATTSVDD